MRGSPGREIWWTESPATRLLVRSLGVKRCGTSELDVPAAKRSSTSLFFVILCREIHQIQPLHAGKLELGLPKQGRNRRTCRHVKTETCLNLSGGDRVDEHFANRQKMRSRPSPVSHQFEEIVRTNEFNGPANLVKANTIAREAKLTETASLLESYGYSIPS